MKQSTVIAAGLLQKKQDQPIGYSALALTNLIQEWAEDADDDPPITDKHAEMLARFAFAIGALSALPLRDKRILNMRLVKAIFSYGRAVGWEDVIE